MQTEKKTGYFILEKKVARGEASDAESDDSDEEDDAFLDDDDDDGAAGGGGSPFGPRPIRKRDALFHPNTGKDFYVKGRPQMIDAWWTVKIEIRRTKQSNKFMIGYPEYSVRQDCDLPLISLFLKNRCLVHEQTRALFLDYVRKNNLERRLVFEELLELVEDFRDVPDLADDDRNSRKQFDDQIKKGGNIVFRGLIYKSLYRNLPKLLPKHFTAVVDTTEERYMAAMEEAIESEPYVFGFSSILKSRFKLRGMEASLENIRNCGLFDKLSDLHKDALVIYNAMKNDSRRNGHTYSRHPDLEQCYYMQKLDYTVTNWPQAFEWLEKSFVIVKERPQSFYFLRNIWECEEGIAENFVKLIKKHNEDPLTFEVDFNCEEFAGIREDPDQMRVAEAIGQHPIVIISGKGGCGKTTTVASTLNYAKRLKKEELEERIKVMKENERLKNLDESDMETDVSAISGLGLDDSKCQLPAGDSTKQGDADTVCQGRQGEEEEESNSTQGEEEKDPLDLVGILMAAPTGKAASVLKRRSDFSACTLHSVMYSHRHWKNLKSEGPKLSWRFGCVEILVVDESSMVSVQIFHKVLRALVEDSKLKKVILLGDIRQLPSIEPGNFLADIFCAMKKQKVSFELRTNHRTSSQLVVDNATRIAKMGMPVFDSKKNFHYVEYTSGRGRLAGDKNWYDEDNDASCELDALVKKLIQTEPCLECHKKSQMIAFRRVTCASINEICCKHYNGHTTKDSKNKISFWPGDKIACNKNGDIANLLKPLPTDKEEEEQGAKQENSDEGIVPDLKDETSKKRKTETAEEKKERLKQKRSSSSEDETVEEENNKTRFLTLDDDFVQVKANARRLMLNCKLRHAWANTIHKFQGSESEAIVYIVSSSPYENWQHVYTAVTRSREHVYIIARPGQLEAAVRREPKHRRTTLKKKLLVKMEKARVSIRDTSQLSQSVSQTQKPSQTQRTQDLTLPSCSSNYGLTQVKPGAFSRVPLQTSTQVVKNGTLHSHTLQASQLPKNKPDLPSCSSNYDLSQVNQGAGSFKPKHTSTQIVKESATPDVNQTQMVSQLPNSNLEVTQVDRFHNFKMPKPKLGSNTSSPVLDGTSTRSLGIDSPVCSTVSKMNAEALGASENSVSPNVHVTTECELNCSQFSDWGASFCEKVDAFEDAATQADKAGQSLPKSGNMCSPELSAQVKGPSIQHPGTNGFVSSSSNPSVGLDGSSGSCTVTISPSVGFSPPFQVVNTTKTTPEESQTSVVNSSMSPDLYSSPDLKQAKCNGSKAGFQERRDSPKRPRSPSVSPSAYKVCKQARFDGRCDNCLSPIRRGLHHITIEESPTGKKWVHYECPVKSSPSHSNASPCHSATQASKQVNQSYNSFVPNQVSTAEKPMTHSTIEANKNLKHSLGTQHQVPNKKLVFENESSGVSNSLEDSVKDIDPEDPLPSNLRKASDCQTPSRSDSSNLGASSFSPDMFDSTPSPSQSRRHNSSWRDGTLATYNGNCPKCNTPIRKGQDYILPIDSFTGPKQWQHSQCRTSPLKSQPQKIPRLSHSP